MNRLLSRILSHPSTRELSPDDPAVTSARVAIILEKAFLRRVYEHWYKMLSRAVEKAQGPVLEIGSGGGFFKRLMPELVTSEVFFLPHVDLVADAQALCFSEGSLGGIVMLDVFHHLMDCSTFLDSAAGCLCSGGALAMIEPWATPFSGFIYRNLHPEPFDPHAEKWSAGSGGPLSGANSALPWIVFQRDREKFLRRHPEFEILEVSPFMPFLYLLSGGVSSHIGLPGLAFAPALFLERLVSPFSHALSMFALVVLRKKP